MKKPKRRTTAPKKIKVTKLQAAKKPWYERPVLLFGVIAAVLILGGVLMAHIYRQSSSPSAVLATAAADSSAAAEVQEVVPASAVEATTHVLAAGMPLPPAQSGQLLPPLRAETLSDGAIVRNAYRAARDLELPGGDGPLYGFVAARELGQALAAEDRAQRVGLIDLLHPPIADRNWIEFEVQRDVAGGIYVLGYVSLDVAEQFGVLGSSLPLPPPIVVDGPPKWQFWKKREVGPVIVCQDAQIALYPDPSPEATCALVLPFDRIATAAAREISGGVARRTFVVDVTLQ